MNPLSNEPPIESADWNTVQWLTAIVRLIPDHFPGHVALEWYDGLTNAVGERGLTSLDMFHRFRRGQQVAYLWLDDDGVFVSPWNREGGSNRTIQRLGSIGEALDLLVAERPPRPWWRLWS